MKNTTAICLLFALAACNPPAEGEPAVTVSLGDDAGAPVRSDPTPQTPVTDAPTPVLDTPCKPSEFEGVPLTHCIADPAKHSVTTALAPRSGPDAGSLVGWGKDVVPDTVAFAVNGGMYGDDLRAVGYFVRDGDRLSELDSGSGQGNFYLKPNGVFFGSNGNWRILTSDTFLRTVRDRPQFGTQSGPMLVIGGKLHPDIADNGPSRAIRNGVGIDADGKAHFVMAQQPLSFGQLARFFRDQLKTPNALYLDGGPASNLWDPDTGRIDEGRVGPIIVVLKKVT